MNLSDSPLMLILERQHRLGFVPMAHRQLEQVCRNEDEFLYDHPKNINFIKIGSKFKVNNLSYLSDSHSRS